jgi:membrane-bound lytic murein transglycosylase C
VKYKNLILFFFLLIGTLSFGNEYKNYLKEHNDQFVKYQKDIDRDFEAYKKVYDDALKEYKDEITAKWPRADISTNHKWVEYSYGYNSKKIVDYEKGMITLETIAKDKREAEQKLTKLFKDLGEYDVTKGYLGDILEQKISKKIDRGRDKINSNEKLIGDILTKEQQQSISDGIVGDKLTQTKYKENLIYKVNIKLPANRYLIKAKLYKEQVKEQASKLQISEELIYSIIQNESSFNPLARSHTPAFGLMQIVPKTAGVDTYYHLYGDKKLLDSEYLYDGKNNILIGSTYLSILYFKHLKEIKDPINRLYCTIASYNTGSGNLAKSFNGAKKISQVAKEINTLTNDALYKKLQKDLPYDETKRYLFKVKYSMTEYAKWIQSGVL